MSRIGLFCFLGRGHLNPGATLGRCLRDRGHEVTVFHLSVAQAAIRSAGLKFMALDRTDSSRSNERLWVSGTRRRDTLVAIREHAQRVLLEAPGAVKDAGIDALIVDQLDLGAGSVADWLGIPFISLSCGPPIYLNNKAPLPYFGWGPPAGLPGRMRNAVGNALVECLLAPVMQTVNSQRKAWGLTELESINDLFSKHAIITQLPEVLDFYQPGQVSHLFHTGPFRDNHPEDRAPIPWTRLNGKPLIYASLGTIRNHLPSVFRTIAEACSTLDMQLVISLGGGRLFPADLGKLPGDPIVLYYARQTELLKHTALTINCGGLNTTLDSILQGIPIVAIPIAEDQPGVAARIQKAGVGAVVPVRQVSVARLRLAIERVHNHPAYRESARRFQCQLQALDGVNQAAVIIENVLKTR